MKGFRETFCTPVRRIRFLGLFDTVNSVPQFETPGLSRGAFPYTALTSAKLIRHAISIDERRAKFRVDLISHKPKEDPKQIKKRPKFHRYLSDLPSMYQPKDEGPEDAESKGLFEKLFNTKIKARTEDHTASDSHQTRPELTDTAALTNHNNQAQVPVAAAPEGNPAASRESVGSPRSEQQTEVPRKRQSLRRRFSDLHVPQDILEVWFAGNHSDIGGGYKKHRRETWPLAHQALVWMVHEAQKAGLQFDEEKLVALNCSPTRLDAGGHLDEKHEKRFYAALHASAMKGFQHDCLRYGKGSSSTNVAGWQILEYLPFKRMDLQPDGGWKAIRSPLPRGEVRDIPRDAKIHHSVIERMQNDEKYRPGNLIMLGEGGRGRRVAPKAMGMGEWVSQNPEDQVSGVYVSKKWAETEQEAEGAHGLRAKIAGWMA